MNDVQREAHSNTEGGESKNKAKQDLTDWGVHPQPTQFPGML
jgi:hypothetical protein